MTSIDHRDTTSLEVLDLYGTLPREPEPEPREDDPVTAMIKAAGRNLVAIIGLFAVFVPAFIACTTLFSAGAGLLVVFVGLFLLVACLVVAAGRRG